MKEFLRLTKALGDENRLRILMFLQKQELCVCQIIEVLNLAPSTVSKHMSILYQAGLVDMRKKGRWRFFKLSGAKGPSPVKKALKWIKEALDGDQVVLKDLKQLQLLNADSSCGK